MATAYQAYWLAHRVLLASMAEWALFSVLWNRSTGPKQIQSTESLQSRRTHELLVNGALLSFAIPIPGLNQQILGSPVMWAGLTIQTSFLPLAIWARRHLGSLWTGKITIHQDHRLIRSGPYRFIRHPIYTAILGMFLGSAITSGQSHGLCGLALAAVAYWRKIRMEESFLRGRFGAEYEAYRQHTGVLLPKLTRTRS